MRGCAFGPFNPSAGARALRAAEVRILDAVPESATLAPFEIIKPDVAEDEFVLESGVRVIIWFDIRRMEMRGRVDIYWEEPS